jgi:hypothetical protein
VPSPAGPLREIDMQGIIKKFCGNIVVTDRPSLVDLRRSTNLIT